MEGGAGANLFENPTTTRGVDQLVSIFCARICCASIETADTASRGYLAPALEPSLRKRSCSLRRSTLGVFGLNATRYQSGWLRSRERLASVEGSAFGCRATFSRMAASGC